MGSVGELVPRSHWWVVQLLDLEWIWRILVEWSHLGSLYQLHELHWQSKVPEDHPIFLQNLRSTDSCLWTPSFYRWSFMVCTFLFEVLWGIRREEVPYSRWGAFQLGLGYSMGSKIIRGFRIRIVPHHKGILEKVQASQVSWRSHLRLGCDL